MSQFRKNKWIRPGLYTTFQNFSIVILGFISFFILARVLSKSDFGVWVLFTSSISILETLRVGFIRQPFIAYLGAADQKNRDSIGSSALYLNIGYSLFISLVVIVIAYPLERFWEATPLSLLLKVYSITNLLFIPYSHFEYLQQSKFDFKGIFYSYFIRALIPTLFVVFMIGMDMSITLYSLSFAILGGTAMGAIICISFGWKFRHQIKVPLFTDIKNMYSFGKYSFGTNLASLFIRNMDSWMLGKLVSTESVALYNPSIRVSNLVEIPTLTVANLVFPKMAENYKADDYQYANKLYERSLSILLAIMIPLAIGIYLFSDWIVLVIAGKEYLESAFLLKITAFYTLFIPFARQFGIFLDAVRKPQLNFYFILGSLVLSIVLNYFFILEWGMAGAAYGTLVAYFLRFVAQQVLLYLMFDIFTLRILKEVPRVYIKGFSNIKLILFKNE
jgi:lipopolysaccharide exporter